MANTYTWNVTDARALPVQAGQTNVITSVFYKITGTDGTHTVSLPGVQNFKYVAGTPFTSVDSLTEAQIISWVQAELKPEGVAVRQKAIDNMLTNMANPPVRPVAVKLPFVVAK
jgi:hypothetical protein